MLRAAILGALLALGTLVSAQEVEIKEWPVPWARSRPRDPYVDGQGRVWFVGQRGDYLAVLGPEGGEFARHDLDPGTGPHNLIVDSAGTVWYAGNRAAHIGRFSPASKAFRKFAMPDSRARDPHTLVFDGAGDIWFTVQGGNFVGKLTIASGHVELIGVPTPRARPYGIVVDARNRPWFTEFGSHKIAMVDPAAMAVTEFALPRETARPRRLVHVSDGSIWYVDYAEGYLGRLDPSTGKTREWRVPGGPDARPYGMARDGRDRIWFVETGSSPNRFVGFDTRTQEFIAQVPVPSGGGSVRHMFFDEPRNAVWFGADTNTIGRARLP